MERIGIAASKFAKGNIWLYNLGVIMIAFLSSLFIFFVAGASIILSLLLLGYIIDQVTPVGFEKQWGVILRISMIALSVVIGIFNLMALVKNLKIKLPK
ncbi:MAG: hypothetical protein A2Z88_02675 [Omnitrophica WOR_2 bacterium GWA2_47_8]|nr:MAG: hypothetical protein A2Z88_02675 [Omnitrophica WOR_2 bacterium GWA2_47_8]